MTVLLNTSATPTPTPTPTPVTYSAQVRQPIKDDGTSVFSSKRGVVPVKFALSPNGTRTCSLPNATIAVFRVAGSVNQLIDESVYVLPADGGSYYRYEGCQYIYNVAASPLGPGSYLVQILIDGNIIGSARFALK